MLICLVGFYLTWREIIYGSLDSSSLVWILQVWKSRKGDEMSKEVSRAKRKQRKGDLLFYVGLFSLIDLK